MVYKPVGHGRLQVKRAPCTSHFIGFVWALLLQLALISLKSGQTHGYWKWHSCLPLTPIGLKSGQSGIPLVMAQ